MLPRRRAWGIAHCRFTKPVMNPPQEEWGDRNALRLRLGLDPGRPLIIAVLGPLGFGISAPAGN